MRCFFRWAPSLEVSFIKSVEQMIQQSRCEYWRGSRVFILASFRAVCLSSVLRLYYRICMSPFSPPYYTCCFQTRIPGAVLKVNTAVSHHETFSSNHGAVLNLTQLSGVPTSERTVLYGKDGFCCGRSRDLPWIPDHDRDCSLACVYWDLQKGLRAQHDDM